MAIKLAIIGAGDWLAQYHLPAIVQLRQQYKVEICGIWNRSPQKAVKLAQAFALPHVYSSLDELLMDKRLNAVSIVVNRRAIFDIVQHCAEQPLAIFCEKPPSENTQQAKQLANLVTSTNVVAFNRRYAPLNQTFKQQLAKLTNIYFVECHFLRRQRIDPHFVTESGIHAINLLQYYFGDMEQCDTQSWVSANQQRHWLVNCRFATGINGIIKFFPCAGVSREMIEVHAENVSAYLDIAQHYTDTKQSQITISQHVQGQRQKQHIQAPITLSTLEKDGFIAQYVDFFEAITTGKTTRSHFANAWQSMKVAEMIEQEK